MGEHHTTVHRYARRLGLEDFKSSASDDKSDNTGHASNSNESERPKPTDDGVEFSVDFDLGYDNHEQHQHPSAEKDFRAEYDEDRYTECWRCGDRQVRINWLNNLGNVRFCQNDDCMLSVKYHCEVTAASTDTAKSLNYKAIQADMKHPNFDAKTMSLDKYTDGGSSDESDSENKRKSQMFTRDKFEDVLGSTDYSWERKDYSWCGEWIYEVGSSDDGYVMRIYSSVDKHTNKTRPKGGDAIRLVVLYGEDQRPVLREKRTNRIKTWQRNLLKKIDRIKQRKDDIQMCDQCGSVMVIRENSESGDKFYGCGNYPQCSNTENFK